jgi:hypothetical protein
MVCIIRQLRVHENLCEFKRWELESFKLLFNIFLCEIFIIISVHEAQFDVSATAFNLIFHKFYFFYLFI